MTAVRVVALVALVGCYKPDIAPCQYECLNSQCPDTLVCNTATNQCVANAGDRCDAVVDASGVDGTTSDCTNFASNVDACGLGIADQHTEWTIPATGADVNTSGNGSITPMPPGVTIAITVTDVMVILTNDLIIKPGASLKIAGTRPLVIVANGTVTNNGSVRALPAPLPSSAQYCNLGSGKRGVLSSSAGGGGGGYGPPLGGQGGPNANAGGAAGVENGGMSLTPLRFGCAGGDGLQALNATAITAGGLGGGAVQLSARIAIVANGATFEAPGQGGHASVTAGSGGGGGGSGGFILLEAPNIMLTQTVLCANGGGGGSVGGTAGEDGRCASTAASGGLGSGAAGGAGAFGPTVGTAGASSQNAGTGGGGGVGRIHFHGTVTMTATTSTPMATTL